MVLVADDEARARVVAEQLSTWQRRGVLHDLFYHRTTMTYATLTMPIIARLLSHGPASLARPLASLEEVAAAADDRENVGAPRSPVSVHIAWEPIERWPTPPGNHH